MRISLLFTVLFTTFLGSLFGVSSEAKAQTFGSELNFVPLSPACRILDTRRPGGGGKISNVAPRSVAVSANAGSFDFAGQGGKAGTCGYDNNNFNGPFPDAVMLTVTVTGISGNGLLAIAPNSEFTRPNVSQVSWSGTQALTTSTVVVPVSYSCFIGGSQVFESCIKIWGGANPAHVIIDLVGIYEFDGNS